MDLQSLHSHLDTLNKLYHQNAKLTDIINCCLIGYRMAALKAPNTVSPNFKDFITLLDALEKKPDLSEKLQTENNDTHPKYSPSHWQQPKTLLLSAPCLQLFYLYTFTWHLRRAIGKILESKSIIELVEILQLPYPEIINHLEIIDIMSAFDTKVTSLKKALNNSLLEKILALEIEMRNQKNNNTEIDREFQFEQLCQLLDSSQSQYFQFFKCLFSIKHLGENEEKIMTLSIFNLPLGNFEIAEYYFHMENNTGSAEHYYQQSILQGYVFSGHEQQNCAIQGLINLKLSLINNTNSAPEDSVQFQITDNHSSSMGLNSLDSGENSESLTVERLENFLNHAAELFELPEAMRYFNELESTHKFN